MKFNRRSLITTLNVASISILAGCLGSNDGDPNPDEWTEVDIEFRGTEYTFEHEVFEDEENIAHYETDQPVEVIEVKPYRKGDKFEIRGTVKIHEDIAHVIDIESTKYSTLSESTHTSTSSIVRHEASAGEKETFTMSSRGDLTGTYTYYDLHVRDRIPDHLKD